MNKYLPPWIGKPSDCVGFVVALLACLALHVSLNAIIFTEILLYATYATSWWTRKGRTTGK